MPNLFQVLIVGKVIYVGNSCFTSKYTRSRVEEGILGGTVGFREEVGVI